MLFQCIELLLRLQNDKAATLAHQTVFWPSGLLFGATVTAPIRKGELITRDNTALPPGSRIAEMRDRQDRMIFGEYRA